MSLRQDQQKRPNRLQKQRGQRFIVGSFPGFRFFDNLGTGWVSSRFLVGGWLLLVRLGPAGRVQSLAVLFVRLALE